MNGDARAFILGAAGGLLTGMMMQWVIDTAPDRFTGTDGANMRYDLEKQIQELRTRVQRLPPRATRDRIESLEEWARSRGYQPPHTQWQWLDGP